MVYGSIADILFQWESLGFFDYVLPFLLIFVIVYGIFSKIGFFGDNNAVNIVIAFVIGLMSLRYHGFLSAYLSELFPRAAVGISMILALLLLVGMFIAEDHSKYWSYGLALIGVVTAVVVIYKAFYYSGFLYATSIDSETIGFVVMGLLVVGLIIAVAVNKGGGGSGKGKMLTGWGEAH